MVFRQGQNDPIPDLSLFIRNQLQSWEHSKRWKEDEEDNIRTKNNRCSFKKKRLEKWQKPDQGFVKLNFDGSKLSDGSTSTGSILRDWYGNPISVVAKKYGDISILQTEALALQGSRQCPWEIERIISDLLVSLQGFEFVRLSHVGRLCNTVADKIAKMGHSLPGEVISNHQELRVLIRQDALGRPP